MTAGLTGGIGSGKSTVARLFGMLGAAVFYSDEAARQAYFNPEVKAKVVRLLGPSAYASENELNKKEIGARIFANRELLKELNKIIHPEVGRMFRTFAEKKRGQLIVKESALLFEADIAGQVDKVIVVAAPDEIRIERVMKRDGLAREAVLEKLRNQLPQEEKVRKAHFVIVNDGRQLLIPQVESTFMALNQ